MWLGLWLASVLFEALLFSTSYVWLYQAKLFRWAMSLTALSLTLTGIILPLVHDWQVWLLPGFIGLYRLVNIYRIIAWRVPIDRLRRQVSNAFIWLVAVQVLVMGAVYVFRRADSDVFLAILVAIQALVAAVMLRATINTWWHTRVPQDVTPLKNSELPSISVLIPARNESDELVQCLESIVANDYPKLEIIVLDDCSTSRRTPEIIRQFAQDGVQFIRGTEADKNWLAKNFACHTLAAKASGEILVFSCADVIFQPDTLRRLVETMLHKQRDMIGVMPGRSTDAHRAINLFQSMRYYWELVFPRRFFKRPPVLSSLWLIRADALKRYGGFASAMHSVSPEATFAKKSVATDKYAFIRADGETLRLASVKKTGQQFNTSVRIRYPQLHRRLEIVCLATLFELVFFIGPFVGLMMTFATPHPLAYGMAWAIVCASLTATYYVSSVLTRLSEPAVGLVMALPAYVVDLVVLHVSMLRYEFSEVLWRGRDICIPVMHVIPHLPKLREKPEY